VNVWALRFSSVSKHYRGGPAYRSLRELNRHGSRRQPAAGARPALRDVSFSVDAGEAFAVIGPNGAGKSTALRIACRITAPTSGRVQVRGRVGALIEVGAGIHPELTGRENIWLYGAILGLRRRELAARFDDIVTFAELEGALDRPVKHYSTGMQLRLGFAVATGVVPDVLVVDEALAVGDARFQLRCLQRMAELVRAGTTLLYVSHDLATVEATCQRALLLVDGEARHVGPTADTVAAYLRWVEGAGSDPPPDGSAPRTPAVCRPGGPLCITIALPPTADGPIPVALGIRDGHAWNVLGTSMLFGPERAGTTARCHIDALPLAAGVYQVFATTRTDGAWELVHTFRVVEPGGAPRPAWQPPVAFPHHWD
jgi:ABC-type polysaccharide/polyol phosphate transport system ATPase subunit